MIELELNSVVGAVLIFIAVVLGNAVGVGGAGIIVPTLLLAFSLQVLEASAQSNFLIFIGFFTKFVQNFTKRHPTQNKPLVDYDLACLFLPSSMLGAKLGIIIHDMSPEILMYICLALTLLLLGFRSMTQGIQLYKQECSTINQKELEVELKSGFIEPINPDIQHLIQEIQEVESKYIPTSKAILILIITVSLFFSIIIEGGKGLPSVIGVEKCSMAFWGSVCCFAMVCIIVTFLACREIILLEEKKRKCGMVLGQTNWTISKVFVFFSIGIAGGILSAMFGLGGGIVLSPLLVELKLHPQAVASTGGFFVMFTTCSSSIVLMTQGYWDLSLGILTAIISICASITSSALTSKLLKKYKHPAVLVIIMGIIIMSSSASISGIGFYRIFEKYGSLLLSEVWKFKSYCKQLLCFQFQGLSTSQERGNKNIEN